MPTGWPEQQTRKKETNGWRNSGRRMFGEERLKVDFWYNSLDAVICQMKERFGEHQLQCLECITNSNLSPKYKNAEGRP